ncbi:uncharacterized protein LOC123701804 [Colias croceus]|uniref:uncharacterized protein LOC123701804 n=1 Tax=Colias crocea TaxID=72248 RepID=UPI001E27C456|nr:uncharacterized protein LOC123701804 [Colias croceus]
MDRVVSLVFLITPVFSQYAMNTGMRADVTFDVRNDRFDMGDLIRKQNKYYGVTAMDPQSSEEYRRNYGQDRDQFPIFRRRGDDSSEHKHRRQTNKGRMTRKSKSLSKTRQQMLNDIKREREARLNNILNEALLRINSARRNEDFAYHDEIVSNSDNEEDFKRNLNTFKANVKENSGKLEDVEDILSNLVSKGRRSMPDEDQKVLLHYAFPVNMRVEGFLQTP